MDTVKSDLTIIGSGMTGMSAALFAAERNIDTALVGSTSGSMFASGYIDLLGVHPLQERRIWENPWEGIAALCRDNPHHPYARLTLQDIRSAFDHMLSFLEDAGLFYRRRLESNCRTITPMGTLKTTYCIPQTMWNGVRALEEKKSCLLVGIRGLKGFSARQIASVLRHKWPDLRTARLSFPEMGHLEEVYSEALARSLSIETNREKFAAIIRPLAENVSCVGVPAILGISDSHAVAADLAGKIGKTIFEIPTMPPSVPGLRLKETFEHQLPRKGVRLFNQQRVLKVRRLPDGYYTLDVGSKDVDFTLETRGIILATGRFIGGGLRADRNRIRETVFDLPVSQPSDRRLWHRRDFLDSRGHPLNLSGLEIDDDFKPLDKSARPAYPNLFAAGSILAHQDWMRMKCGSGLAIATAHGAVKAFMKCSG